jgi:hypothetical protein
MFPGGRKDHQKKEKRNRPKSLRTVPIPPISNDTMPVYQTVRSVSSPKYRPLRPISRLKVDNNIRYRQSTGLEAWSDR